MPRVPVPAEVDEFLRLPNPAVVATIRPDGSGLRRLTHFRPRRMLGELAFSPDAKRIVFTKGGNNRDMFVMRANGTGVKQITRTKVSGNWPDWGPK